MKIDQARKLLKADYRKVCGSCGERLYSPFDVLFMHKNSACIDCYQKDHSDEQMSKLSNEIFEITGRL